MNNERMLYISSDDDLPTICTRLEHAHSRHVTLVMPLQSEHLHAFGTWRMLHAYTRRRGITVHIVSESAYMRSIAHSARFTVAKTLDVPQEKRVFTRPSTHRASSTLPEQNMEIEEPTNILFLAGNESFARPVQQQPHVQPNLIPSTLMFTNNDVLLPPHPSEPPVRVSKPPQPLNMPRIRRTRPLTPPTLPWDDVDDELLPPRSLHKPKRRRTNPLVQSMMRRRRTIRGIQPWREATKVLSFSPVVCIGIFILVRSIVQYLKKRESTNMV